MELPRPQVFFLYLADVAAVFFSKYQSGRRTIQCKNIKLSQSFIYVKQKNKKMYFAGN